LSVILTDSRQTEEIWSIPRFNRARMSSNSGGQRFQVYGGRGRGAGRARTKSSAPAKVAPRALELVLVDTLIKAKSASAALMTEMVLALDCEGTALSRTGRWGPFLVFRPFVRHFS